MLSARRVLCLLVQAMAALSPPRISDQRRTPEDTVLYRVVQEHLDTVLAHAQSAEGAGRLPDFVTREFEEYLSSVASWPMVWPACAAVAAGTTR